MTQMHLVNDTNAMPQDFLYLLIEWSMTQMQGSLTVNHTQSMTRMHLVNDTNAFGGPLRELRTKTPRHADLRMEKDRASWSGSGSYGSF